MLDYDRMCIGFIDNACTCIYLSLRPKQHLHPSTHSSAQAIAPLYWECTKIILSDNHFSSIVHVLTWRA